MTRTKKLVCGTQRALDKEIEAQKTKGWTVERTDKVPRGKATKLITYLAYLKREKQWPHMKSQLPSICLTRL